MAFASTLAVAADTAPSAANLSAAEIVEKNVAARGGLQAWRAVKTMSQEGKLGAGGNQRATLHVPNPGPPSTSGPSRKNSQFAPPTRPVEEVQLPFLMEQARPRKMRFELQFNGQTGIQVYDGANGWKLRPYLNRRVVEPYTEDELKTSSMQADLDGPLVDYTAKGTKIEFVGKERVEDRDTYKIKLTLKSGEMLYVWIDTATFLEAKITGQPRRLDGALHPVEIYFRDYRAVSGLQIPFVLETKVLPVGRVAGGFQDPPVPPEKAIIEKVVINPQFDEALFAKPQVGVASNAK